MTRQRPATPRQLSRRSASTYLTVCGSTWGCNGRDTLYFVIPPADTDGGDTDHVLNQIDLWGSGDQFVWVLPHDENVALLNMREHYRRTVSERGR